MKKLTGSGFYDQRPPKPKVPKKKAPPKPKIVKATKYGNVRKQ